MNCSEILELADQIESLDRDLKKLNNFLSNKDWATQITFYNEDREEQFDVFYDDNPEVFSCFDSILENCIDIIKKKMEKLRLQMIKELGDTND